MDVDLTGLLVFRHIAETGSFSKAARYWKISQPAVSLMISRLEGAVGLVLLERSPTGARLTPAGADFAERVNEVCDAYLGFIEGMRTLGRRMDHEILVGVDGSWFGAALREALEADRRPEFPAAICEAGPAWWDELESSRCDVVVAGRFLRGGLTPGIQEVPVCKERGLTVAWNPDFYRFDPVNFDFPEILATTILVPDQRVVAGFNSFLLNWCELAYGIQAASAMRFPSEAEAAAAAAAGLGILLSPGDAASRLGAAGANLTYVRTFELLLPEAYTFSVFCRSGEESKEVLSTAAAIVKLGRKLLGAYQTGVSV